MPEELRKLISQAMSARFEVENQLIHRAWEDEAFKQELLINPKSVFARELGEELPNSLEIEVLEETETKVYLVLPINSATSESEEELSEEALKVVAGGVCLGYTIPRVCVLFSNYTNANGLV